MGTPTYTLISETVLGSAQASVTFSSIPGTYKDLVVEFVGTASAFDTAAFRVNGDTGTNYSFTRVQGDGSAASSARVSNISYGQGSDVSTTVVTGRFEFLSYANANVFKTVLARGGDSSNRVAAYVNLWRSTSAITSIQVFAASASNLSTGFTARLWGVVG